MEKAKFFNDELDCLFEKIIMAPSPSGYEDSVRLLIKAFSEQYCNEVYDLRGNIIGVQRGAGQKKVMLSAHMDEVGMLVKYISEDGMIFFVPIGSLDIGLLPGLRITVWHDGKPVSGVIARKAVHLLNESEKKSVDPLDLCIDIGCRSRTEASGYVKIGDIATFEAPIAHLTNEMICSRGLDNKAGVMALCKLMQSMAGKENRQKSIYYAFTIQEEIGCRGIQIVAKQVSVDETYIIDAIHATDYLNCNKIIHGDIALGKGLVISIAPDVSRTLSDKVVATLEKWDILYQLDVKSRCTNTEAPFIQLSDNLPCTSVISFPVRYMHSPNEICNLNDIKSIPLLLEHLLLEKQP